jgi:hypothetical protein
MQPRWRTGASTGHSSKFLLPVLFVISFITASRAASLRTFRVEFEENEIASMVSNLTGIGAARELILISLSHSETGVGTGGARTDSV